MSWYGIIMKNNSHCWAKNPTSLVDIINVRCILHHGIKWTNLFVLSGKGKYIKVHKTHIRVQSPYEIFKRS